MMMIDSGGSRKFVRI